MTRTERLLRLARERGDLLAVATLEGPKRGRNIPRIITRDIPMTETELRAAWGDR